METHFPSILGSGLLVVCVLSACAAHQEPTGTDLTGSRFPYRTTQTPTSAGRASLWLAARDANQSGSYAEAAQLYRQIDQEGPNDQATFARFRLGQFYWMGTGVPQDYAESAQWFSKAISAPGLRPPNLAYINLGILYFCGEGVPRDRERARKLWTEAGAAPILRLMDAHMLPTTVADWTHFQCVNRNQ